jgi:hypothetical protein
MKNAAPSKMWYACIETKHYQYATFDSDKSQIQMALFLSRHARVVNIKLLVIKHDFICMVSIVYNCRHNHIMNCSV